MRRRSRRQRESGEPLDGEASPRSEARTPEHAVQSWLLEQARAPTLKGPISTWSSRAIVKLDEGDKRITSEALQVLAKATELFVQEITILASFRQGRHKVMRRDHMFEAIAAHPKCDFLEDVVPEDVLRSAAATASAAVAARAAEMAEAIAAAAVTASARLDVRSISPGRLWRSASSGAPPSRGASPATSIGGGVGSAGIGVGSAVVGGGVGGDDVVDPSSTHSTISVHIANTVVHAQRFGRAPRGYVMAPGWPGGVVPVTDPLLVAAAVPPPPPAAPVAPTPPPVRVEEEDQQVDTMLRKRRCRCAEFVKGPVSNHVVKAVVKNMEDVQGVSTDATFVLSTACSLMLMEWTLRAWNSARLRERPVLRPKDLTYACRRAPHLDTLSSWVPLLPHELEHGKAVQAHGEALMRQTQAQSQLLARMQAQGCSQNDMVAMRAHMIQATAWQRSADLADVTGAQRMEGGESLEGEESGQQVGDEGDDRVAYGMHDDRVVGRRDSNDNGSESFNVREDPRVPSSGGGANEVARVSSAVHTLMPQTQLFSQHPLELMPGVGMTTTANIPSPLDNRGGGSAGSGSAGVGVADAHASVDNE